MKKIISSAILTVVVLWLIGCCRSSTVADRQLVTDGEVEYVISYRIHYSATATEDFTYKFYGPAGMELYTGSWRGTNYISAEKIKRSRKNRIISVKNMTIVTNTAPLQILSYSDTFKKAD